MKKLTIWLGALALAGTMAIPAFAAQRLDCCAKQLDCCVEQEKAKSPQVRSEQEPLPWETPGGKVRMQTETNLLQ
jgi:hypothetical protein